MVVSLPCTICFAVAAVVLVARARFPHASYIAPLDSGWLHQGPHQLSTISVAELACGRQAQATMLKKYLAGNPPPRHSAYKVEYANAPLR